MLPLVDRSYGHKPVLSVLIESTHLEGSAQTELMVYFYYTSPESGL